MSHAAPKNAGLLAKLLSAFALCTVSSVAFCRSVERNVVNETLGFMEGGVTLPASERQKLQSVLSKVSGWCVYELAIVKSFLGENELRNSNIQDLSLRRSQYVKGLLVSYGFAPDRIYSVGERQHPEFERNPTGVMAPTEVEVLGFACTSEPMSDSPAIGRAPGSGP